MTLTHQAYYSPYMIFKYLGFFMALYLCTSDSYAADNKPKVHKLVATPKRCVALRQGQVCYQEVTFEWRLENVGNYCLIELSTLDNIKCWSQVNMGKFIFDFQSNKSKTFALRKVGQEHNLVLTNIIVSWVYKSSKRPKSSWKLF